MKNESPAKKTGDNVVKTEHSTTQKLIFTSQSFHLTDNNGADSSSSVGK